MHPAEALFFRQDCKIDEPLNRCSDSNCFRQPIGLSDKCIIHLKEQKEKALYLIFKIFEIINDKDKGKKLQKWNSFLAFITEKSQQFQEIPKNTIVFGVFINALKIFSRITLTLEEKNLLKSAFKSKIHLLPENLKSKML